MWGGSLAERDSHTRVWLRETSGVVYSTSAVFASVISFLS